MKTILLSLCAFFLLSSCKKETSDRQNIVDDYKAKYTSAELLTKFDAAYKDGSTPTMSSMFEEWNANIKSNSDAFKNQNDTMKVLYDIFKAVYLPHNLAKLGASREGLNSPEKYVVVQNKLFYFINDGIDVQTRWWSVKERDSIINFRPKVNIEPSKVLYLTKEYRDALTLFLGSTYGTGGIMNPAIPAAESAKRADVLRPFITVIPGHWGNYWHIETHPEIEGIQVNKSLNRAKAFYRVGWTGGEVLLSKEGNNWVITTARLIWIE